MPPTPTLPRVQLTSLLPQALTDEGLDPDAFAQYFAEWKAIGPEGEYEAYYFGKDGFYDQPKRTGRRVLRHVHLAPTDTRVSDAEVPPEALARWEKDWKLRRRKTSDTSLVYAEDPAYGYLLIYIAWEPEGHEFAQMATVETAGYMNQLADVAEELIRRGTVLL